MKKILLFSIAAGLSLSVAASGVKINKRVFYAASQPGIALFEDFEGSDNSAEWLPEGWTVECRGSQHAEGDDYSQWHVQPRSSLYFPAPVGKYYAAISYQNSSTAQSDEWMISPEFTVPTGSNLSYMLWHDPSFLFKVTGSEQPDDVVSVSNISATLQVYIITDGKEIMLEDIANRYDGMTYSQIAAMSSADMQMQKLNLDAYAGKTAKIAFRYVGADGNWMYLDDIKVALPDAVATYTMPWTTLFGGVAMDESWTYLPKSCAVFPAYSDVVFSSEGAIGVDYSWDYQVPGQNSQFATASGSDLTIQMLPDFTTEATAINSVYSLPTLTASGNNLLTTSYKSPVDLLMAGGHPVLRSETTGGQVVTTDFGLATFPVQVDGFDIYVEDPAEWGEAGIPIFGYSDRTAEWWKNHMMGEDAGAEDKVEVEGYVNMFFATEKPLVIDKIWTLAKGQPQPGATLTARIIALTDEFENNGDVIALATCKYEDILVAQGGQQDFLNIPFVFDEPVVMSTDVCNYYIVEISGFNDGNFVWFAPEQSYAPDAAGLCHGFLSVRVDYNGTSDITMVPAANFKNEYSEDMMNSFAIFLGASFPYLKVADEAAPAPELSDAAAQVSVPLLSFYDPARVAVEVPEGFEARVEGRYHQANLIITGLKDGPAGNFTAKVKCPGYEISVPFSSKGVTVAINDIIADGDSETIKAVYTVDGRQVEADVENLPAGIYIVTYADGTTRKISK